jgi:hypothetical protein
LRQAQQQQPSACALTAAPLAGDAAAATDQLKGLGPIHSEHPVRIGSFTRLTARPVEAPEQLAALLADVAHVLGADRAVTRDSPDYWTRQAQVGGG